MRVFLSQNWRALGVSRGGGRLWLLPLLAVLSVVPSSTEGDAKTPGSTYCFYGKCHRVKSIVETQGLVGKDTTLAASFYDDCKRDRYNPCGLTSSGEKFHPNRADNAASPIYPDGTTILVWSPESKRAAVLRVNNAGPYWGNRKLDVSRATAEYLGFAPKGVAKLQVRVIEAPTAEEAAYAKNRKYDRVPGYIGQYVSAEAALEAAKAALTAVEPENIPANGPLTGFAVAEAALAKPNAPEATSATSDAKSVLVTSAETKAFAPTADKNVKTVAAPKKPVKTEAKAAPKKKSKAKKRVAAKKKARRKSRVASATRKRAAKRKAAIKVTAKPKPIVAGPPNDNAWFRKQVRSHSATTPKKFEG